MSGRSISPALRRARFWRRVRRIAPLLLLLFASLALLMFVSARVVRATLEARNARQVEAGAALGVRPWMTVPYIARVYHVPEDELYAALDLAASPPPRRAPLRSIAEHDGRNLDADIAALNTLIEGRRGPPARPSPQTPPPAPRPTP